MEYRLRPPDGIFYTAEQNIENVKSLLSTDNNFLYKVSKVSFVESHIFLSNKMSSSIIVHSPTHP